MSENSVDSTIEEQEYRRIDRGVEPNGIARCFKKLFCCIKRRAESNAKETIRYDPDEYDYIVEKLVVKRVPFALFAISADLANRRRPDDVPLTPDDVSQSSSLSTFSRDNPTANVVTRENLNSQAKSSVWKQEKLNRFNALHSDLREFERPSKNPNFSRSKLSFAEDISVVSSTKTDLSSRTSTSSITVQDDVSTRDDSTRRTFISASERNDKSRAKKQDVLKEAQNPSTEKDRDKFVLGRNRRYIVSPFQVKRGSLDLVKPKNVARDFGVDGKSLTYIQESTEEKSSELAEDSKDCDLRSNTAVRWRITVRRRRANVDSEREKRIGEDIPSYVPSAVVHLRLYVLAPVDVAAATNVAS
ncbi:uncharacterized protein [Anoplolepis gracilipes]|uniref:uncharacterized protein n=1 Tax=Anoplolepis gracilipes TaxID=354296 RepID=UPI003BA0B923